MIFPLPPARPKKGGGEIRKEREREKRKRGRDERKKDSPPGRAPARHFWGQRVRNAQPFLARCADRRERKTPSCAQHPVELVVPRDIHFQAMLAIVHMSVTTVHTSHPQAHHVQINLFGATPPRSDLIGHWETSRTTCEHKEAPAYLAQPSRGRYVCASFLGQSFKPVPFRVSQKKSFKANHPRRRH